MSFILFLEFVLIFNLLCHSGDNNHDVMSVTLSFMLFYHYKSSGPFSATNYLMLALNALQAADCSIDCGSIFINKIYLVNAGYNRTTSLLIYTWYYIWLIIAMMADKPYYMCRLINFIEWSVPLRQAFRMSTWRVDDISSIHL